jgi:transposase InsO family protein
MKYRAISENVSRFPVSLMCRCLRVSKAGFYAWQHRPLSARAKTNERLLVRIRGAHKHSRKTYGSPRIHATLKAEGVDAGRHRIARLMRAHGIRAKTRRKFKATTQSDHDRPVAENLLSRDFSVNRPDVAWVGDITFVWTKEGWLYLAVLLDLFSRKVVGWALSERIDRRLVVQALDRAIRARKPPAGLLVHSDRGSQYCAHDYRRLLKAHGLIASMSKKGDCYDNAAMESWNHSLKVEAIHGERFSTRQDAKKQVFEYIEIYYNRKRLHSSLGYLSPETFEQRHVA